MTHPTAMPSDPKPAFTPKLRFPKFRNALAWQQSELGKEASILKGKGISKSDIHPDGTQPCIRYGELYTHYDEIIGSVISRTNTPADELFLSKANDVIIPSSGETKIDIATASCVLLGSVALGGDLNVIRSTLNGRFLSYYLNGPKRFDIAKVAQGHTVVHLYPYQLEELEIAFPSPAEQQKIAECLSALDELIAAESQKLDALKAHATGLMQELFPREGKTLPRLRFPEFKKKPAWKPKKAGALFSHRIESGEPDLPIYSVTMNDGMVQRSSLNRRVDDIKDSESNKKVLKDDLAYNMMRMWQGAFGVAPEDCMVSPAYVVLAPEDGVYSRFFEYLLKLPSSLRLLTANSQGLTKDRLRLYYKDFATISLLVPDFDEQQRIATCLSSLRDLIAAQSDRLAALQTHKQGLMQQLFPCPEAAE